MPQLLLSDWRLVHAFPQYSRPGVHCGAEPPAPAITPAPPLTPPVTTGPGPDPPLPAVAVAELPATVLVPGFEELASQLATKKRAKPQVQRVS